MISFFMKKFLILITFILLNTNVVSAAVKVGCGNIKFTEKATIDFHEYLTWKISRSDYTFSKPKNLGAMVINPKNKSYGKFLYLVQQSGSVDYVGGLYDSANIGLSGYKTVFSVDVYVFAKKNKIVWCKSKEKISRDITLEGLQNKLKELGFFDGNVAKLSSESKKETSTKKKKENVSQSKSDESNILKEIKELNELYKSGVLTKEQFEKAKDKLLN